MKKEDVDKIIEIGKPVTIRVPWSDRLLTETFTGRGRRHIYTASGVILDHEDTEIVYEKSSDINSVNPSSCCN